MPKMCSSDAIHSNEGGVRSEHPYGPAFQCRPGNGAPSHGGIQGERCGLTPCKEDNSLHRGPGAHQGEEIRKDSPRLGQEGERDIQQPAPPFQLQRFTTWPAKTSRGKSQLPRRRRLKRKQNHLREFEGRSISPSLWQSPQSEQRRHAAH